MQEIGGHTIVLGGVGGDSHSVGLYILRQALSMNGYQVFYLGTQNRLEEFFHLATLCNVIMISIMDGHAPHYVRKFPELMRQYNARRPLWYLGGNLTIGDGFGYDTHFLEMGFDRVAVKFVDIQTVLSFLERDLCGVESIRSDFGLQEQLRRKQLYISRAVCDAQLEPDTFERTRSEVLDHWKTGHQARSIEANAEFLGRQPSFPEAQALVNSGRMPILIQPRSGTALVS